MTFALDRVSIEGFKSLSRIEDLALRPVNILIGANGSGKSNFIEVFSFLNAIWKGGLQEYVLQAGGADKILHSGLENADKIIISLSLKQDPISQYQVHAKRDKLDSMYVIDQHVNFRDGYEQLVPPQLSLFDDEKENKEFIFPKNEEFLEKLIDITMNAWRIYDFRDTGFKSPMKRTNDVNDNRYLRPDGSNLAAFLHLLRNRHEGSYRLIRRAIRLVAPFFEDFHLEPQELNEDKIRLEWRQRGSAAYFDCSSFSDGTLRFVALVTLFLQPLSFKPSVIVLDEPETGLHSSAVTLLASLVKYASVDTQVVLATQSSLLLDQFNPEDVLVADRVDGATKLTRLASTDLKDWLTDYGLGELWQKNEFGGRPASEHINGVNER